MEEKTMKLDEVLKMIVDDIEAIQVPISMADQISRPLCQSVSMLRSVIDQMREKAKAVQEGDGNVQS